MKILVTAGNTLTPIDRVRGITNIFTGRTGASIAVAALTRGHHVTLLTSHPEAVQAFLPEAIAPADTWTVRRFRTFDDLQHEFAQLQQDLDSWDAIIHCAAVSDYRCVGVYSPGPGTSFAQDTQEWQAETGAPRLLDRQAGKVKSDAAELWLRLERTPKLIDQLRLEWGYRGTLVKFKLEVGLTEQELLRVAERSRKESLADLMVANVLESVQTTAWMGPIAGEYVSVARRELAVRLVEQVEQLHQERKRG